MNTSPLDNPFYYLENFRQALAWIAQRYDDLLDASERRFIDEFADLPTPAQGLLVRMVMRKGALFRASKLSYAEIGDPHQAVVPLLQRQWVDARPPLELSELFHLLRKDELSQCFKAHAVKGPERKHEWLERLQPLYATPQPLEHWHPSLSDAVFGLKIMPLCNRLRLLYFGNLYQEWSEFVLADLGIYRYEKVEFSAGSRAINERTDIDVCLQLHDCREALETCIELHELAARVIAIQCGNPWLQMRRAKLLFRIGQQAERLKDWPLAMSVYRQSSYYGARSRQIRVLELGAQYAEALTLAEQAQCAPESDAEAQHLSRVMPRLQRKLGLTAERKRTARIVSRFDLQVTPLPGTSVERLIRLHLEEEQGGEVHYVENALINSLFGLLCWRAIFAPLPGAFFHPFHSAPSDLYSPDFYPRRAALFDDCIAQLQSDAYLATIRENFESKFGLQSPFVFWGTLTKQLLEHALHCLPAEHLRHWFRRLLQDIKANRTGMPDLIQFFPEQRRYRMIEVKGPGDRLQDNQLRWLDFCAEHGMPVEVCYVQWATQSAELCSNQGALSSS
ncbi:VRR-NUC domain-containing protein [Pseudomonas syringae]|uniref:VRR-NUC domain-containing protein n=1 Tax=Pseudomonas syringae TaxID=317 RepID=UPI0008961907|nr:VRR-NUC domain-containing protein [Pseudomonas syringae]SDX11462.1 VRR-NUC domain-containing protein [Pseudomonas syringae]SFM28747.1 VRR-NUC domain-containing protein [Pseudomonas syringae]